MPGWSQYAVVRQTLLILTPEFLLLLTSIAMMTAGPFIRRPRRVWSTIAAAALGAALLALLATARQTTNPVAAVALNDAFSFSARLFLILTGFILLGMAHDQVDDARAPEFFGSLLMMNAGAMLVAAANELVLLFVGLELVSMPTYLLLYLSRRTESTLEAAMKYFFLSIFSSALLLYGLAFLYGATGVSNLKALAYFSHVLPGVPQWSMGLIAVVFVVAGLGFRVAAVPFHFYAPDVYQGSPTVIAALLAWIPKVVGFLALLRTVTTFVAASGHENPLMDKAIAVCWVVAAITMTLGNTVALLQDNLKRLLAYSSIAHAGYLMIGAAVACTHESTQGALVLGGEGILFYLVAYALMTLGAFGAILVESTPERPVETVEDLAGLARRRPLSAFALAVCLFSLAGIPPLAGFWGKLWIFVSAISATPQGKEGAFLFQLLAVIGAINAAIGAYYYLRIVIAMYLRSGRAALETVRPSVAGWPTRAAVAACAGLTLLVGLYPLPVIRAARSAAEANLAYPVSPDASALVSNVKPAAPAPSLATLK
jgi:NADH-quinone oxidoreductase subunit N